MAESEAETPSTPGEFESKYFEFHGVRLPPFCRGKMEEIANFPVRPSDVWIVTYPKSGTSLLQEVVYLVSQGADPDEIGLMNIDEQLPVLEYPQPGLDIIKELTSPRLIKSHLPYRFLPSDLHNGDSKAAAALRPAARMADCRWLGLAGVGGSRFPALVMHVRMALPLGGLQQVHVGPPSAPHQRGRTAMPPLVPKTCTCFSRGRNPVPPPLCTARPAPMDRSKLARRGRHPLQALGLPPNAGHSHVAITSVLAVCHPAGSSSGLGPSCPGVREADGRSAELTGPGPQPLWAALSCGHRVSEKLLEPVPVYPGTEAFLLRVLLPEAPPVGYGSWFEHVQEFWEHHMDSNVLFLKYEDMHRDLVTMVEQLARFLGVSCDKAQLESLIEHCHQLVDQCCNAEALPVGRGRVGLWKDIFTVSMNEKFDLVYKQKMGKCDLTFDFYL
nr:sulfotransferase 4A1 [Odocoileus virginianus texanus]